MPIVLKLTVDKHNPMRGIDHYWSVIMRHELAGKTFTAKDIDGASRSRLDNIKDFLRRLLRAGLIERVGRNDNGELVYRALVRQEATPKVRRDGTVIESASGQKCMWNGMRSPMHRQGFTATDLAQWSSTDETRITVSTAKSYIKTLAKAGYLIEVRASTSRQQSIWRLAPGMNTGPLPPMILRTKSVFDQNKNQIVGPVVTEEVQP